MLGVHAGLRKRRNRAAHARRATVDGPPGARTHSMPRPRGHACATAARAERLAAVQLTTTRGKAIAATPRRAATPGMSADVERLLRGTSALRRLSSGPRARLLAPAV